MINGDFLINNIQGMQTLHAFLNTYPDIKMPKRKKTLQSIDGASSSIVLDENSYENRDVNLSMTVQANSEQERVMRLSALYAAFDTDSYVDFIYYGEPNMVYKVTNADVVEQDRVVRNSYYTDVKIKLSAQAFKYYKPDDLINVSAGSTVTLNNRFNYSSAPFITVLKAGTVNIGINSKTYTYSFTVLNKWNILCDDTEQWTDGDYDINQEFPKLKPGINTITSNFDLQIQPRWRLI
ncbi:hypothetical protein [Companilactobacillus metriopterae]|uniref:hypothetical protein n=1 Tax=Companilactobacillus metriopterae TaxID=1909267 RepID=UPI00100BDFB2|nr:hypothetical protein [Companilactobacillus metriopterae]